MDNRHFVENCECGWDQHHHHHDNDDNSNGILFIFNQGAPTIIFNTPLQLTQNEINIPNNNDFRIENNAIFFQPGIYLISYMVTARLPGAAPTTNALTIQEIYGGRVITSLNASAYNNINQATISGTTMYTAAQSSWGLINVTRDNNFVGIPIIQLQLKITAYKVYDLDSY